MNHPEPDWETIRLPLRKNPVPDRGQVDLWLIDLDSLPLEAGPGGLTRKEKVLKLRIQQQFVLRLLLGSYLNRPGKDVILQRSERGKPGLDPSLAESGLDFNLSHSGNWLAIALAREISVGVDIEVNRVMRRPVDLANRFFHSSEADWLAELEEPERSRRFLTQWTAREALVKAAGTGLADVLPDIRLVFDPVGILSLPATWPAPENWSLIAPQWPAGLLGHIAIPAVPIRVRQFFLQNPAT
jgi:4'-phosphopantetheinyl transferase